MQMGNEIEGNNVLQTDPVNNFTPVYELLPATNSQYRHGDYADG